MQLSFSKLVELKEKIIRKVSREIDLANANNSLQEVLTKYGIYPENKSILVDTRTMKILVLGALAGKIKDYQIAAKKFGISENNIEFVDTYDEKRFNVAKLENSMEYSDIIYGPNPHKQVGMGNVNSFLAEMEKNPDRYPRVIRATANDKLKITISGFKNYLSKTRYFQAL